MIALYGLTIFLSAALLFLLQPMFARVLLPQFGGSPGVWNTAMVFYQTTLLAGYAYAHASTTRLGVRKQSVLHIALLLAAALTLPFLLPKDSISVTDTPVWSLLRLLALTVGATFFAASTTTPVLQKWLASTAHHRARDPYPLYAASNAGSMLALLAYPLWVEPGFRLQEQLNAWAWAFGGLVILVALCAVALWQAPGAVVEPASTRGEKLTKPRRLHWVLLAFAPSSLMLGLTTYFSTEIGVIPMLWVIPLALYLLTLILAFSSRQWLPVRMVARVFPIVAVVLVLMLNMIATEPIGGILALHLVVFFAASLLCHARLAADRPGTGFLTEYYLWLAVGGALGGVFNALLAPLLFNSVVEYPVALALVCWLALPAGESAQPGNGRTATADVLWSGALGALTIGATVLLARSRLATNVSVQALVFGVASLVCFLFSRHPLRFGLSIGAVLLAGALYPGGEGQVLFADRSFYGVHRVTEDPEHRFHQLIHGTTLHGRQSLDPAHRREPLTYYHPSGPAGDVLALYHNVTNAHIAVVGLGAGSLASYAQAGQQWTYFEIDPTVVSIARDRRFFTFLSDSLPNLRLVMGDARQSLGREADGAFDLIVIDAYTSDAIPVHLATREALALFMRKLRPGGRLAFHISNNYFDLEPVFGALGRDANLACLTRYDSASPSELATGKSSSAWLVMAKNSADLGPLSHRGWHQSRIDPNPRIWTDDYSNLLRYLRWR